MGAIAAGMGIGLIICGIILGVTNVILVGIIGVCLAVLLS